MHTIGQLMKRFGLSRSTLIYYDDIGLLTPSARSNANYRMYTDKDLQRMEQIILYKEAGLPLEEVAALLDEKSTAPTELLEQHLSNLNSQISQLRQQQQKVVQLLGKESQLRHSRTMDKAKWVSILAATGMSEQDMQQWHVEFERCLPEAHQDFLESLGIESGEIRTIRRCSQEDWVKRKHH
ncbi:MerR family transcriptional regulator [Pontibacterium sp.]|uniref:MerR family transcriptional regulator n=1 Tax=Pontibacterium sp. TaxID=2036026 RepID=UPI0035125A03